MMEKSGKLLYVQTSCGSILMVYEMVKLKL